MNYVTRDMARIYQKVTGVGLPFSQDDTVLLAAMEQSWKDMANTRVEFYKLNSQVRTFIEACNACAGEKGTAEAAWYAKGHMDGSKVHDSLEAALARVAGLEKERDSIVERNRVAFEQLEHKHAERCLQRDAALAQVEKLEKEAANRVKGNADARQMLLLAGKELEAQRDKALADLAASHETLRIGLQGTAVMIQGLPLYAGIRNLLDDARQDREELKKLRDDLAAERELRADHQAQAARNIAYLKADLADAQKKYTHREKEAHELSEQIIKLRDSKEELATELSGKNQTIEDLHKVVAAEREQAALADRQRDAAIKDLELTCQSFVAEKEKHKDHMHRAGEKYESLRKDYLASQAAVADLQARTVVLPDRYENVNGTLHTSKNGPWVRYEWILKSIHAAGVRTK